MINKNENLQNCGFAVPANYKVKLEENEKKDKYLNHEIEGDANCN